MFNQRVLNISASHNRSSHFFKLLTVNQNFIVQKGAELPVVTKVCDSTKLRTLFWFSVFLRINVADSFNKDD